MKNLPLAQTERAWMERACSEVTEERLARLNMDLVDIPSPMGKERQVAEFAASHMREAGLDAFYQPIDEKQGNAVGRVRGGGGGADLLLYAPLDTIDTEPEEDGTHPYLKPEAHLESGNVTGLGAENPKGYATCVMMAAEAVRRARIPLKGSVIVGLGAGAMPFNKPPYLDRFNAGQGTGCEFMLQQGVRGDFAIIAKPFYFVSWEEAGLCWFRVQVKGIAGYVGVRHLMPYKNPIVDAAKVIEGLEKWFLEYAEKNSSGLVAPQGVIGALEAGRRYRPTFTPATCDLFVDLRISPRTDPMDVRRQFGEAIARIKSADPGLEVDWQMVLAIPGSRTEPDNWIVQSCMRAWEHVEGKEHPPPVKHSGATDANTLRRWGIPTARLGLPPIENARTDDLAFMQGVNSVAGMKRLTQCFVYSIVDTCTREREAVLAS